MRPMPLFAPPNTIVQTAIPASLVGAAAQFMLAGKLMALGHRVAVALVDDDGVDLIVNYRTLVQVKSSGYRERRDQLSVDLGIAPHVDAVALHANDNGSWWIVPAHLLRGMSRVRVSERHATRYGPWCEAWHVFDGADPWGGEARGHLLPTDSANPSRNMCESGLSPDPQTRPGA